MTAEVGGYPQSEIGGEIARRQLTGYSDFEIARIIFEANLSDNGLNLQPIALPGGIAYPLESRVSDVPRSWPYDRKGDVLVMRPSFPESPTIAATFVAFWDGAQEAAIYHVERDISTAAAKPIEIPVGEVALGVLRSGRHARLSGSEAQVFGGYPTFGRIDYTLTETTSVEIEIDDPGGDNPVATFSLSGRVGVLDVGEEYYLKVDGDTVLKAAPPEPDTLALELPAGVVNPRVTLPAGTSEVRLLGHGFIAVREGSVHHLEGVDSFDSLYQKARRGSQHDETDAVKLVEEVFGIKWIGLPDIGPEGHAVLVGCLDWSDHTVQFLLHARSEVHKIVAQTGESETIERAQLALQQALEDAQTPIPPSVVGPLAVAAHLLARLP